MDSVFGLLSEMATVPAGPEEYHAEGSVLQHTVLVAEEMAQLNPDDPIAALMAFSHDLGKIATPSETLPHHYKHDERGAEMINGLPEEVMSTTAKRIASVTAEQHMRFKKLPKMRAAKAIRLVITLDEAGITAERMRDLVLADNRGRIPHQSTNVSEFDTCISAVRTIQSELNEEHISNEQHRLQMLVESYREIRENGGDA